MSKSTKDEMEMYLMLCGWSYDHINMFGQISKIKFWTTPSKKISYPTAERAFEYQKGLDNGEPTIK